MFEVDEVLGVIPSYWVSQEYAGSATAYRRTVIFECRATVVEDPAAVAAQQLRLLARYAAEGGFRAVAPSDPLYRAALEQLAAVHLAVERTRVKFKLAQNRPAETRPSHRSKLCAPAGRRGRRRGRRCRGVDPAAPRPLPPGDLSKG